MLKNVPRIYKIGIEALQICVKSGVGKAVRELCKQVMLNPHRGIEYHFYVNSEFKAETILPHPAIHLHPINLGNSRLKRMLWMQFVFPGIIRKSKLDLVHYTCYTASAYCPAPYCLSVYDMIALQAGGGYAKLSTALHYRLVLPRSIRNAVEVFVPSKYVKAMVSKKWPGVSRKIKVVPLGIGQFGRTAPKLPSELNKSKYLLMVGNIEPKKNHFAAIRGFRKAAASLNGDLKLVIVGRLGWKYTAILKEIQGQSNIRFYCDLEDTHLEPLYQNACALLFPSLHEGYGLPPLEAAYYGIPVIGSQVHALDDLRIQYIQVNPNDVDSIAQGIETVLLQEKKHVYSSAGTKKTNFPTWAKYSEIIQKFYLEIIG